MSLGINRATAADTLLDSNSINYDDVALKSDNSSVDSEFDSSDNTSVTSELGGAEGTYWTRVTSHSRNNQGYLSDTPMSSHGRLSFSSLSPVSSSESGYSARTSLSQARERLRSYSNDIDINLIDSDLGFLNKDVLRTALKQPHYVKVVRYKKNKGPRLFERYFLAQELTESTATTTTTTPQETAVPRESNPLSPTYLSDSHTEGQPIWCTKFSLDGKYMATAGKSGKVNIWKVIGSRTERWEINSSARSIDATRSSLLKYYELARPQTPDSSSADSPKTPTQASPKSLLGLGKSSSKTKYDVSSLWAPVFHPSPYATFDEHLTDVLNLDWSKNNFLLTASMDRTAKVWSLQRNKSSLATFSHPNFVTDVKFHPTDDRFFVSGCLDHKCRLWSIIERRVIAEYDCGDIVTTISISKYDGKYTVVGTFHGNIHVLLTSNLALLMTFRIAGKYRAGNFMDPKEFGKFNPKGTNKMGAVGSKITGIEVFQETPSDSLKVIVTSDDSRIRIFDLERGKLVEYFKGFHSGSSQHRATSTTFNNIPLVICSSEDHKMYAWRIHTHETTTNESGATNSTSSSKESSLLTDLAAEVSGTSKASASQTPSRKNGSRNPLKRLARSVHGDDFMPTKNKHYTAFLANDAPITTVTIAPSSTGKILSLTNDIICELSTRPIDLKTNLNNPESGSSSSFTSTSSLYNGSHTANILKIIGPIIITTDTHGIIRVFRKYLDPDIRLKVIEDVKRAYSPEGGGVRLQKLASMGIAAESGSLRSRSSTSMLNPNFNKTVTSSPISVQATVPLRPPRIVVQQDDAGAAIVYSSPSTVPNDDLIPFPDDPTSATQPLPPIITGSRGGSPDLISVISRPRSQKGSFSSMTSAISSRSGLSRHSSASRLHLRCDVCGGDNFQPLSGDSPIDGGTSYRCVDCNTVLSRFK